MPLTSAAHVHTDTAVLTDTHPAPASVGRHSAHNYPVAPAPVYAALKRLADVTVCLVAAVLFPFALIPIAIAIKAGSRGPVFYVQERTGLRGRTFRCYKFRTMHAGAKGSATARPRDPRITRVGSFLRRTSLDELPQIFNVLRGDMSLVGPRPHMLAHTELYSELIPDYMLRHAVRPGMTGWAQANGFRGPTDELWKMERRVEYDLWYVSHRSLLLDLRIIFMTAAMLLRPQR